MKKVNKFTYAISALLLVLLLIFSITMNGGGVNVYASTSSSSVVTAYEQSDVLSDLQGSIIGGEEFDIEDYPHTSNGEPQIISFVEFGYSNYEEKQSDYGLYVYVYNPQELVFDTDSSRNKIQVKIGNLNSKKYNLTFLSFSHTEGFEGRFYKFKIDLTLVQKQGILSNVLSSERIYQISGIELSFKGEVTEYTCATTYKYTGYALGYGSALAESSTLSCTVDGFDKCLELDVKHTYYRPKGDFYNGKQSQLNSCFFRVPNKYFEDYGELTKIACEWYEYFTKPILVSGENNIIKKINSLHGANLSELPNDGMYYVFALNWEIVANSWFKRKIVSEVISNNDYAGWSDKWYWSNKDIWLSYSYGEDDHSDQKSFAAAFYTDGVPIKDYKVDGDYLLDMLLYNSQFLDGEKILNRYSEQLFEDYVEDGYERGYNYKEISADEDFNIFWEVTTQNFWQKFFSGKHNVSTIFDTMKAIEKISDISLKGSDEAIAERLYINEKDVSILKEEYDKAQKNDETVVIFRYSTSDYFSVPCRFGYRYISPWKSGELEDLLEDQLEALYREDYNAYVAQEALHLGFDIISLYFTLDGVEEEIPVAMSPQDVASDIEPPLDVNYHDEDKWYTKVANFFKNLLTAPFKFLKSLFNLPWWVWLIIIIVALAIVLWILSYFFPVIKVIFTAIGNGLKKLWGLICLPFRWIKALFTKKKNKAEEVRYERQDK